MMPRSNTYWQDKISLFLHDPVHKAIKIPGHESRSHEIAELLVQTPPAKDIYSVADQIAAGLTRASLPGYSEKDSENGAVNFTEKPFITHPLVTGEGLALHAITQGIDNIHNGLLELLEKDIGYNKSFEELRHLDPKPLSGHFDKKTKPEEWAKALYFYLFFVLKRRLRLQSVGGLGGLWDILPADTRMPDHSIWHHCGLASALGSSASSDPEYSTSLAVFSISPVQPFIAKARKLRDSWSASVILSYLSFTGIRYIMEELGPDHVVYPSMHDQALVEKWIGKEFHLETFLRESEDIEHHRKIGQSIASFPNKFVFLCPTSQSESLCASIEKAVTAEWLRIASLVGDDMARKAGAGTAFKDQFSKQIGDYWQFSWSSIKLAGLESVEDLKEIIDAKVVEAEAKTVYKFAAQYGETGNKNARLYGTTHSALQILLAAGKSKPGKLRNPQHGEKCPLCGEFEVLHDYPDAGKTSASEYKKAVDAFWNTVREKYNPRDSYSQIGKSERICAICSVKRFIPIVMKKNTSELLHTIFGDCDRYPSTTELAASRYLEKLTACIPVTSKEYDRLINALHESETDGLDDEHSRAVAEIIKTGRANNISRSDLDKYYAVLLMDGDRMGDLINGGTIDATWEDVMHPELRRRFESDTYALNSPFAKKKKTDKTVSLNEKRLINPAVHAAISDSLNSFARFAVAPIINAAKGKLIYAGGDDVCAVLPLESVLDAAERISRAYRMKFVTYGTEGAVEITSADAAAGKLGMHLGNAPGISISGAIVIAHHKESLREVLIDAHSVLDNIAKRRAGRNALAIRLKKRSGGDRDLYFKWDALNPFMKTETLLSSFKKIMHGIQDAETSSSLVYRMGSLKIPSETILNSAPEATAGDLASLREETITDLVRLFAYEIKHSGTMKKTSGGDAVAEKARRMAGLCIQGMPDQKGWFNAEGPVIARFLAPVSDNARDAEEE